MGEGPTAICLPNSLMSGRPAVSADLAEPPSASQMSNALPPKRPVDEVHKDLSVLKTHIRQYRRCDQVGLNKGNLTLTSFVKRLTGDKESSPWRSPFKSTVRRTAS